MFTIFLTSYLFSAFTYYKIFETYRKVQTITYDFILPFVQTKNIGVTDSFNLLCLTIFAISSYKPCFYFKKYF